jgi:hypothetical protein
MDAELIAEPGRELTGFCTVASGVPMEAPQTEQNRASTGSSA